MPKIEDNSSGQLPTIGEEFSFDTRSRSTLLGGKVAKINSEQTTQVSYNINKDLENLRKIADMEQIKHNKIEKNKENKNKTNKYDENILLADEFKSGSSVFSMEK